MEIERSYNWGTLLYPESCIYNLEKALDELQISCALSPLHDQDICEDTGEPKKPHYHLLLHYSSLKSRRQFVEDVKHLGAVGAENIRSLGASVRYLAHMDSPDKAKYSPDDIKAFNGFNIEKYINSNGLDIDEGFSRLVRLALEHDITDYSQLVTYCLDCDMELLPICRKSAFALNAFLRSLSARKIREQAENVNKKAFEIAKLRKDGFIQCPELEFEQIGLEIATKK